MELLFSLIIIILGVSLIIFLYVWIETRKYIHIHVDSRHGTPENYNLPFSNHTFKSSDGFSLKGWLVKADSSKGIVILVHGFTFPTGGKSIVLHHAKYLFNAGYSVFMFDIRSFGESDGTKFSSSIDEWKDAEAAYGYIKSLYPKEKIGFFGTSFGGAVTINTLGKAGKGDFVILNVPFGRISNTSKMKIKERKLPVWLIFPFTDLATRLELGWNYDSKSPIFNVPNIKAPTFVIQALNDTQVEPNDALEIYEKLKTKKELWQVKSDHDVYHGHEEEFEKRVLDFLSKYV